MSLSSASTSVPTLAEPSGADGGSPDLVWNGEAGGHEPWRGGPACLPHLRVGGILYSHRPELLTGSPLTIPPGVGERVS